MISIPLHGKDFVSALITEGNSPTKGLWSAFQSSGTVEYELSKNGVSNKGCNCLKIWNVKPYRFRESYWRNLHQSQPFPNVNGHLRFALLDGSADTQFDVPNARIPASTRCDIGQLMELRSCFFWLLKNWILSGCPKGEQSAFVFPTLDIGLRGRLMDTNPRGQS
jgi:hypothetical protein